MTLGNGILLLFCLLGAGYGIMAILNLVIKTNKDLSPEIIECGPTPEELAARQESLKKNLNDLEAKKNAFFDNPDNQGYYLKVKLDNGNELKTKVYSPVWEEIFGNNLIQTSKEAAKAGLTESFTNGYFLTDKDQAFPISRITEIRIERDRI